VNTDHRRYSPPTEASIMYSLATHVLSLPYVVTDAFVVLPGEGENWRVRAGVRARNRDNHRLLLLAPFNTSEATTPKLTLSDLVGRDYGLKNSAGVIIGGHAEHTGEQAEWLYGQIMEHNIRSITVGASPYHDVRGYLTLLKYLLSKGCRIPMIAAPTPVPPNRVIPESEMDSWTLVHGEAKRVKIYQEKGDVATLDELRGYLAWLWEQEPFRSLAC
jgi:hypothetical protein